jgi:hypothetical protein
MLQAQLETVEAATLTSLHGEVAIVVIVNLVQWMLMLYQTGNIRQARILSQ